MFGIEPSGLEGKGGTGTCDKTSDAVSFSRRPKAGVPAFGGRGRKGRGVGRGGGKRTRSASALENSTTVVIRTTGPISSRNDKQEPWRSCMICARGGNARKQLCSPVARAYLRLDAPKVPMVGRFQWFQLLCGGVWFWVCGLRFAPQTKEARELEVAFGRLLGGDESGRDTMLEWKRCVRGKREEREREREREIRRCLGSGRNSRRLCS